MNRHESNKMNMFHAVNAVFVQHQEKIDEMQALSEAVARYRDSLRVVTERNGWYLSISNGATAAKNNAVSDAIGLMAPISNAIRAFASRTNDEKLKAETRISKSQLRRCRREELVRRIGMILETAQAHATDLAGYKITGEIIEELGKSLETLRSLSDEQQRKIAGSRANRELLSVAFEETDGILKDELDAMMEVVKTTNVEFYHEYRAARVIKDLGGSHTSKNGKTEAAGPEPAEERLAA